MLSLFLTRRVVQDPPYLKRESARGRARIDYIGLGLLVLGIGCLQLVLDKGQEKDWFSTTWVAITLAAAVYALLLWIIWEWRHPEPIVDLRLFKNRNFATAIFFTLILGMVLFSTTVVIPQFLQLLLGYTAERSGEALAGGGIVMLLMMPIAGILVCRIDPRAMMAMGFLGTAVALRFIVTHFSLQMDFETAFCSAFFRRPAWHSFSCPATRWPTWASRARRTTRFRP